METARYTYIQDHEWPCEAVDIHQVVVRNAKGSHLHSLSTLLLLGNALYIFLVKDKTGNFLSCLLSALLAMLLLWKPVKKESVVVFPAFGVQLEAHYVSGRIARRFVPISKILKPVLIECVTPVTCYWSLSLILREEEEMMLVFKELRPPLKILVPIWRALREAIDIMEDPDGS